MYPFGMAEIAPEKFIEHMRIHLDAFKKTRLAVSAALDMYHPEWRPVYDWAVEHGMAIRRDGICGNSDGRETTRARGRSPGIFELFGSYEFIKEKGWWDGIQDDRKNGFTLAHCTEIGKPSYIGLAGWHHEAHRFLEAERPLLERLANRMGYHFVLERAAFPSRIVDGAVARLRWANRGVAYVYEPCIVALGLLDSADRTAAVCWPSESAPESWTPDETTEEALSLNFGTVAPGDYRLGVALFRHIGDARPAYRLGIEGRLDNGWYALGPASVGDESDRTQERKATASLESTVQSDTGDMSE